MSQNRIELTAPFTDKDIKKLKTGDMIYISGTIYTARDAAHKQLCELLEQGKEMPFDFDGAAVFYAGPCPAKPGKPIGSIGPTTSGRMDLYPLALIEKGLKVMIGKGFRSQEVIDAIVKNGGIYFAAIGGAATLKAKCVECAQGIGFEEVGTEAIRKLVVKNMPVIVAIDSKGNDVYS